MITLVIVTLFVLSIAIFLRLKLTNQLTIESFKKIRQKVCALVFNPLFALGILSGIFFAISQVIFSTDRSGWLNTIFHLLLVLLFLGPLNGYQISKTNIRKFMSSF